MSNAKDQTLNSPSEALPWSRAASHKASIWLALVAMTLFSVLTLKLPAQRVGDGSEYYALYYAIQDGHRTFMTEPAWTSYDHLYDQRKVAYLVDTDSLRTVFPALNQRSGADFNHFWFYPAMAATLGGWLAAIKSNPHAAFLFLHALLAASLIYLSARFYGKSGVLAVGIAIVGSPIFWFVDKVHTEFLTFTCVAAGTTLFVQRRYLGAAAWLALASTQNISIAATALFSLAIAVWQMWGQTIRIKDVMLGALALALMAIHPIYYFTRVGVIDPQLLAGGAKIGLHLGTMYIWIIDPDIGLIPNWPLSILILVALALALRVKKISIFSLTTAFVAIFLATNLYAQSSTENLNSGATIDIARYATWYIGLFVPGLAYLIGNLSRKLSIALVTLLFFAAATIANAAHFFPRQHEKYLTPTRLSAWIQEHAPSWYDPPAQIFADRNVDVIDPMLPKSYAVLGPGCRKVLIVVRQGYPVVPMTTNPCEIDPAVLPARVLAPVDKGKILPDGRSMRYVILSDAELAQIGQLGQARPVLEVGRTYQITRTHPVAKGFLGTGWAAPEAWGTWSSSPKAFIKGRVDQCPAGGYVMSMDFTAFITPKNPVMKVAIGAEGLQLWGQQLTSPLPTPIIFPIPCTAIKEGMLELTISISGSMSPNQAGISDDPRELGIGLRAFKLQSADASPTSQNPS
ncbi:hypothetical protein ACFONN_12445 [Dyella humi]|uniref:Glycosyltransferase RgtA/B/C/D-like domain-containing protein n=1 Tax=Dyella humi TaxID=1770547 RepID=A0ABW8IKR2_9GAMM